VLLIDNLGFGSANVVVAVPQAWIDVRTMADLDDVTTGFRAQHNRRMRVATKYINLTRTSLPPMAWSTTASSKAPAPPKARPRSAPPR
jgi:ATP phosphoribosyltransferase